MLNPRNFHCSNCKQALRVLSLSGHYQRTVDIDVCDPCGLIWFDEVESVRLAGQGIADLIRTIHGAMRGERPPASALAGIQHCPVCGSDLERVYNVSRFGRTAQLECPNGHGYYQTYMLYLAEKGFIRPLEWKDINHLSHAGQRLYCANCGAGLAARPCERCPYCQSALGVLDPARLASAIDIDLAGTRDGAVAVAATLKQSHCDRCGGAVDPTRDIRCPHCQAPMLGRDTDAALAAAEAARSSLRQNGARRLPKPPLARLNPIEGSSAHGVYFDNLIAAKATRFKLRLLAAAVILFALFGLRSAFKRTHNEPDRADPAGTAAAEAWFDQRFAQPEMACAADASTRTAVRIRSIAVSTEGAADMPAIGGPGAAMRAAMTDIKRARRDWIAGKPYEQLLMRYSGRDSAGQEPMPLMKRGELPPRVERVAFCIAVNEISPVILSMHSFQVLQVVEAQSP